MPPTKRRWRVRGLLLRVVDLHVLSFCEIWFGAGYLTTIVPIIPASGLPRRFALRRLDFVGDGAGGIFVRPGIGVAVASKAVADLHRREHSAHLDRAEL